jgi:glycosyltransferase involved in cell wall biosynthesis
MITSLGLNMVVRDEAHRIATTLEAVLPLVDEAVIVDQSSDDDTADICREAGATVLSDVAHGYCEPSRQLALDATKSDWVLVLDADERCSDEFVADMRTLDAHLQVRVKVGAKIAGEVMGVGQPIYRIFRRRDFYCKAQIHSCPLPFEALTPSMGLWILPYVGIWDEKSWAELLGGLENYERLGRTDVDWLVRAREAGVTGPELDAMTRPERHALGFGPTTQEAPVG